MLFVLGINPWQCMMIPFSELVYDQGCGKKFSPYGFMHQIHKVCKHNRLGSLSD
jgi:hypothetical protein